MNVGATARSTNGPATVSKKKAFVPTQGVSLWRHFLGKGGYDVVDNIFDADFIQFTGGQDVSPELYNCLNIRSNVNKERDLFEAGIFAIGRRRDIPMVGVCRGGQFLNVMCGGAMIQHCEGHQSHHRMKTNDGREMMATSTHHQMMIPTSRAIILASANIIHKEGDGENPYLMECDPEVVLYHREKCLCFQPHPEWGQYQELTDYYFSLLKELI